MHALTIGRLALRYRLPPALMERRRELECVREAVFEWALERVLTDMGVLGHESLCLRRVRVRLRLSAALGEQAMIECWTSELTRAVKEQLRSADPREFIRYRSPVAALVDLARGLARADLQRGWAWVSLGLVDDAALATSAELARALVVALIRRPEAIVATLVELAREPDVLSALAPVLAAGEWVRLASAALVAHGLTASQALSVLDGGFERLDGSSTQAADEPLPTVLRRSPMVAALAPVTRAMRLCGPADDCLLRAWIALAALGEAPQRAPRWLVTHADVLATVAHGFTAFAVDRTERPSAVPSLPSSASSLPAGSSPASSPLADATDAPLQFGASPPETAPVAMPGPAAYTRLGGLLFLVAVFRELDLWVELAELGEAHGLELRHVLHRFGRDLLGEQADQVADDDPGLLAFVGLPPTAAPPRHASAPALDQALETHRHRVIAALESRLSFETDLTPARRGAALLEWLIYRHAEVVADPGWIELRLDGRDVDTAIRRAGLDLDPDWLPALGVVVKFVYV